MHFGTDLFPLKYTITGNQHIIGPELVFSMENNSISKIVVIFRAHFLIQTNILTFKQNTILIPCDLFKRGVFFYFFH